jgi:carbon starvation protein CstA
MVSFIISIAALILGYVIYGKIAEKVFVIKPEAQTPAIRLADGVDYVAMPGWKAMLIQLLNIAGTGPIFGAIAGALFGPAAFGWIVFGCIFAGAVHDYMVGMLSIRNDGANISEIVGKYLGRGPLYIMRVFSVVLLIFVGVVFVTTPAQVLQTMFAPLQEGQKIALFDGDWIGPEKFYIVCITLIIFYIHSGDSAPYRQADWPDLSHLWRVSADHGGGYHGNDVRFRRNRPYPRIRL